MFTTNIVEIHQRVLLNLKSNQLVLVELLELMKQWITDITCSPVLRSLAGSSIAQILNTLEQVLGK